jgi:glucose-6-phosphate dehydrogenase assembly protein OpcA
VAAAVGGGPPTGAWQARDTTPNATEEALRRLLAERFRAAAPFAPARVLNLVVVVDAARREDVEQRLAGIRDYHPSRLIECVVVRDKAQLDATASVGTPAEAPAAGLPSVVRERVVLELGERHLRGLDTIVGPLLAPEIPTLAWAPHGHDVALDRLRRLAEVALVDSVDAPDVARGLDRAAELTPFCSVVDLAWLRSTPWRERVAAAFDPAPLRPWLGAIVEVAVRHRFDSAASAWLFCGWLATRLGWELRDGAIVSGAGPVKLRLRSIDMEVRGLAGIKLKTAGGEAIALDRAAGGLRIRRRHPGGREQTSAALGASRGEAGILGEGVRQALLRDPTYRPALGAARALVAAR